MENKDEQVFNYIRDLGVELLRTLERGTQATLSLRDTNQVKFSMETNDLLKTLVKIGEKKDYSECLKEQTKALKDISKAHADGTKAVITAIKEAKPTIPPFPKEINATVDLRGIIEVAKNILTSVKDSPAKLIKAIEAIGTKKKPVYVVQVDEDGKILEPREAQSVIHHSGVVRTVTLANVKGIEFNPATEETLASVDEKLEELNTNVLVQYAVRIDETSTPNVTYIGKAEVGSVESGSVWQIFKIDESSGFAITYADGDYNFNNVWDNRLSLTYS